MDAPKSRIIPLLSIVYCLVAAMGVYLALLGQLTKPEPLPSVDVGTNSTEQLVQAKRIMVQAQQQQPELVVLTMFYKGWLLKSDYRSMGSYSEPAYDGDSFERRLEGFNDSVSHIDEIYQDALVALLYLSAGSLILTIVMLVTPGYLVSVLLAAYPAVVVFTCAALGINSDPLEWVWIPFIILGGAIFVVQLVFSFRFGRPEHRAVQSAKGLMMYRRGLLMLNLGLFLLVAALMMASGSLVGPGRTSWTRMGLALFGEGGITFLGVVVGIILVIPGIYYLNRKHSDDGRWK